MSGKSVDQSDLFEKLIQSIMSTDDYVKREAYIRKNYKYIIPLAKWLAKTVVSLDASSADANHASKQSKLDEDDQREYQSSSEEDTFALFALNCLLFISSAATSETTLTPLCDIFVDESQSAFLHYLNNRLYTGRANDSHIGILVNYTRYMPFVDRLVESIIPQFPNFASKLVSFLRAPITLVEQDISYNNKQLISAYLTNLTQAEPIRSLLVDEKLFSSLLLVYENNRIDVEVKKAAISIIRNCCFDTATHSKMISEEDDELIIKLVYPLAGPEEFDEEDVEKLPIDLQYLPADKTREMNVEIRKLLLETLFQLCSTRFGRTLIRDSNVYLILREYHKWETDPEAMLSLENLIDVIIKTEDELYNLDNLKEVDIPDDLVTKFDKMDRELRDASSTEVPAIEAGISENGSK